MYKYILSLNFFLVSIFSFSQTIISSGNQVGFSPNHYKTLVLSEVANDFEIIEKASGKTVYTGKAKEAKDYSFANEKVRIAEFSDLTKPGVYFLKFNNTKSQDFTITKNAYQDILKASVKSYYMIRASSELKSEHVNEYSRVAGHLDNVVYVHKSAASEKRPENSIISSPGGWYDAGDYNKYIVNSGITCYTLLRTYDRFKKVHTKLDLNIPESANKKADLLDEIEYNINWMLTMQDPNDGGVYHKLTHKNFSRFIVPEQVKAKRYVVQKSVTAALNFTAVIAYYARLVDDKEKKEALLKQAKMAFEWALKNPEAYYIQPQDISTGEYGDKNASDEFFWAAIELYISTKDETYISHFEKQNFGIYQAPTWQNVKALGIISLLNAKTTFKEKANKSIIKLANKFEYYSTKNAYGNTLGIKGDKDFNWGSNSNIANQTMILSEAYFVTKDKKYIAPIFSNVYYILGQNATGYCFVTGFGTKSPQYPHHRLSSTDTITAPYPGLLAGGPNKDKQDIDFAPTYTSNLPALSYTDDVESYASNEIAINWTAPLVYVLTFAHCYK